LPRLRYITFSYVERGRVWQRHVPHKAPYAARRPERRSRIARGACVPLCCAPTSQKRRVRSDSGWTADTEGVAELLACRLPSVPAGGMTKASKRRELEGGPNGAWRRRAQRRVLRKAKFPESGACRSRKRSGGPESANTE
jgi:hypothetical protein